MELPFIYIVFCKYLRQLQSLFRKFKHNILIVLGLLLFVLFCFLITNVKAVTPKVIVDGYDMSDIYRFVKEDEAFFIMKKSDGNYLFYVPNSPDTSSRYRLCCRLNNDNSVGFYGKGNDAGTYYSFYNFDKSTLKWNFGWNGISGPFNVVSGSYTVVFASKGILNRDNKTYFYEPSSTFIEPSIKNSDEDLIKQSSNIIINAGDISQYDDTIQFSIFRMDKDVFDNDLFLYNPVELYTTTLDWTSFFYKSILDDNNIVLSFNYQIPYSSIDVTFEKGKQYQYELSYKDSSGTTCYYRRDIVMGSVTETEKLQESINSGLLDLGNKFDSNTDKIIESNNKTQEAIKEQTEVSKNIFEKIGDILSYINPFSENFFVYKLIELLINALKSLFIPSDNFFNDWLADMNDYFSDRFGILYYPIDLIIDFLTRVVNISSSIGDTCVLTTPEFSLFGTVLLRSFTFDFNTIIENETFRNIYNIYLVVMDVILSLMLINFAKNTFTEVFGGRFTDEVIGDIRSNVQVNNKGESGNK